MEHKNLPFPFHFIKSTVVENAKLYLLALGLVDAMCLFSITLSISTILTLK